MTKQAMLFDFHNIFCKSIWLEVANEITLFTQNLLLHELQFPVKKANFFTTTKFCIPGYYTGNMLLAVSKSQWVENQMKLVLNISTWNFLNHLQFGNVSKIKVMGVIWALDAIQSIYLCSKLCTNLLILLCERKKSFIIFPTLILYFKL